MYLTSALDFWKMMMNSGIFEMFSLEARVQKNQGPNTGPGRCFRCSLQKSRKTKTVCTKCSKCILKEHTITYCDICKSEIWKNTYLYALARIRTRNLSHHKPASYRLCYGISKNCFFKCFAVPEHKINIFGKKLSGCVFVCVSLCGSLKHQVHSICTIAPKP